METCPDCHGAGRIPSRGWAREEHLQISSRLSVCPTCEGLGEFADWADIPGSADDVPIDETTSEEPLSPQWFGKTLGQSDRSRGK
jgi:hypothetical protein